MENSAEQAIPLRRRRQSGSRRSVVDIGFSGEGISVIIMSGQGKRIGIRFTASEQMSESRVAPGW